MSINKEINVYNKEDIPDLEFWMEEEKRLADLCDKQNYHKDYYSNSHRRKVKKLEKLVELIKLCNVVEDYDKGLALIDGKFVVSITTNSWRIVNKSKWYKHKKDLQHFVSNYICKDNENEANT
tara:strand:+ start:91 stop:459 length:369 start_codon:yes stop_codon:yes gene_type:complete